MKKDLKSYVEHDKDYHGVFDIESFRKIKDFVEKNNELEKTGFKKAIAQSGNNKLHIDIGSGGGWLLYNTSPIFEKVIGVEPSKAACDNVNILIKEYGYNNIEIINADMIDALKTLDLKIPAFLTTTVVLSHIKDFYVKQFLQLLNTIPNGSTLYFCERHDRNIHQNLWHIRRKYWWAKNLSEWQLEFFDIENDGYKTGIFGRKVGKENVTNHFIPTLKENILWFFDGIKNKFSGIIRYSKRKIKKCLGK